MNDNPKQAELFTITARRCRRCGGLLTSSQGIQDGYGACCLRKMQRETREQEQLRDQTSLFDFAEEAET